MNNPVEAITRSLRVLLVAERQHMRKLVRGLLVNIGIKHIDEAADGIAAIEAIRALDPDVVILDWDLPLLNGPEVVRIIRASGAFGRPNLPIVMVGVSASRRRVAEAKRLGVDSFVVLPISAKTLLDRILSAVTNARRAQEAESAQGESVQADAAQPESTALSDAVFMV